LMTVEKLGIILVTILMLRFGYTFITDWFNLSSSGYGKVIIGIAFLGGGMVLLARLIQWVFET